LFGRILPIILEVARKKTWLHFGEKVRGRILMITSRVAPVFEKSTFYKKATFPSGGARRERFEA
jgi:hypothetical protein